METFIQSYGYWAILIGTFLEGETILILGGVAAQQGYMTLSGVILAAFAGSLCGDQLFFYLGRRHSDMLMRRRPAWRAKLARAQRLIERFQTPLILGFRFLYGLRTITPVALGISGVPLWRFVVLNLLGAGLWAVAFGAGGYLFGNALEILLGDLRHYERYLFLLIIGVGAVIWGYFFHRNSRQAPENTRDNKKENP